MEDLHRAADKFFTEVDHLDGLLPEDVTELDEDTIALALSVAKRARAKATTLVRALAAARDGTGSRNL